MRTPRKRYLTVIAAGALVAAACSPTGEEVGSIGLESADTNEDGTDTDEPDPDQTDTDREEIGDPDEEGSEPEGSEADDEAAGSEDETSEAGSENGRAAAVDVVDLTEAIPGTWPVGDAGTVAFSIVDGALVLDDVTANDGWVMAIDEQDPDEIEVDFSRGNVEWEIEIELEDDGRTLEIEIDQDIEPADPGTYDIGDAGTFSFRVVDGGLVLGDLNVADGWTLTELDEEPDEIEFELTDGPRRFDVEVELEDDGTIELEIDYEVVGPVGR